MAPLTGKGKQRSSFQPYTHPTTVYDLEALASPRRTIARRVLNRRLRWVLGGLLFGGMVLYLMDVKVPGVSVGLGGSDGHVGVGGAGSNVDTDDIWSNHGDVPDVNQDVDLPTRPTPDKSKEQEAEHWALNEYGDSFRRQPLTPLHPDIAVLPAPSTLFSEVSDIASFLQPPTFVSFPVSRLRDIISEPPTDENKPNPDDYPQLPDDAYSRTWKRPDIWDGERGEVRKVQWEGFSSGREDTWETKAEKEVRLERRDAVKRGFVYAWQKYKDYAWGE